ncbi:unnamed protein product [Caretta caretta]
MRVGGCLTSPLNLLAGCGPSCPLPAHPLLPWCPGGTQPATHGRAPHEVGRRLQACELCCAKDQTQLTQVLGDFCDAQSHCSGCLGGVARLLQAAGEGGELEGTDLTVQPWVGAWAEPGLAQGWPGWARPVCDHLGLA